MSLHCHVRFSMYMDAYIWRFQSLIVPSNIYHSIYPLLRSPTPPFSPVHFIAPTPVAHLVLSARVSRHSSFFLPRTLRQLNFNLILHAYVYSRRPQPSSGPSDSACISLLSCSRSRSSLYEDSVHQKVLKLGTEEKWIDIPFKPSICLYSHRRI